MKIKSLYILLICCILLPLTAWAAPDNIVLVDDFEAVDDWTGLTLETDIVYHGDGAGRWDDHLQQTHIAKSFDPPLDASQMRFFECWLYSGEANGAEITLVLYSQNEADPAGADYYYYPIAVTWTGWQRLHIPLDNFTIARNPLGWQELQSVMLSASGWGHEPLSDTLLILDDMRFGAGAIANTQYTAAYDGDDFLYTYTLTLEERMGTARTLSLQAELPDDYPFTLTFQPDSVALPASGSAQVEVHIRIPAAQTTAAAQLTTHHATVLVTEGSSVIEVDSVILSAAIPLPARATPRLLLNAADITRIDAWAVSESWASSARSSILNTADAWPDDFVADYYLTAWELPPEGGQWGLWYICPQGGAYLNYEGPGRHVCPLDGQVYSGWPYEQVIYARMHQDLAEAARDLGLAYQLSGETAYAQSAAEILRAYADAYLDYPYHDINDETGISGGRVTAQTLDESQWLIPIAWAYDMIVDSGALSGAQREHIEQELLYAAVTTIVRNPAGMSNWQSWHNAAIGAVGFALQDPLLIAQALNDPANGFEYQMQASVSADGFWYEGSWGYHLYALQAHRYLTEMAARSGIDLYANTALRKMFAAPLNFAMPDMTLPPFNDSGTANLLHYDELYEIAYRRYGDALLSAPLGYTTRGRDALLWGAQTLPSSVELDNASALFSDAGYAVLRNTENDDDPRYLAFDFGPHGGWHGHYDKLGFVSYARGTIMALDPGTQSYAAPTHNTWDKVTVAHNTIVVDEQAQDTATGALHQFVALPGLSVASADAGEAYTTTHLQRTMILGSDYMLDHYRAQANDGQAHTLDWIYHNPGDLTTTLSLSTYGDLPTQNGYQHLSAAQAATTGGNWRANFRLNEDLNRPYGNVWPNESDILATFSYNDEQAAGGRGSGKLTYDFSAVSGYVLYSTPAPEAVEEAPLGLSLAIYGDNSGNRLRLRLYDSTDERYVTEQMTLDWNGWQTFTFNDVVSWTHFLGDDNGIFDPPVSRIGIELSYEDGAAASGIVYVDDIRLLYADGEQLVEDFETPVRQLDLWMLSEAGTTVVTGNGLGPDLTEPVPFVMARRTAQTTTFATLMAPAGLTQTVSGFATLPSDAAPSDNAAAYVVSTTTYTDRLLSVPDGDTGTPRTFGEAACDGEICLVRRDGQGNLLRLILATGAQLEDDGVALLHSSATMSGVQVDYDGTTLHVQSTSALRGAVYIWGPTITQVTLNGAPCEFTREGEYVVLAAAHLIYLPIILR